MTHSRSCLCVSLLCITHVNVHHPHVSRYHCRWSRHVNGHLSIHHHMVMPMYLCPPINAHLSMPIYLSIHPSIYVCIYACMYVCVWMRVCVYAYLCVRLHACVYACMYPHMHRQVCGQVCVCMYAHMCVCMYMHIRIWICACLCVVCADGYVDRWDISWHVKTDRWYVYQDISILSREDARDARGQGNKRRTSCCTRREGARQQDRKPRPLVESKDKQRKALHTALVAFFRQKRKRGQGKEMKPKQMKAEGGLQRHKKGLEDRSRRQDRPRGLLSTQDRPRRDDWISGGYERHKTEESRRDSWQTCPLAQEGMSVKSLSYPPQTCKKAQEGPF